MASLKSADVSRGLLKCLLKSEGLNYQTVRYRKPRFKPQAPSKVYRVRVPTHQDLVERELMMKWQNNYNTERKSLQSFLYHYNFKLEEGRRTVAEKELTFEQKFAAMCSAVDKWNKETAEIKEGYMRETEELARQRAEALAEREEIERKQMTEQARIRVLEVQEKQEDFITPDNLDVHLEELINTRVDYDFALYLDGKTTADMNKDDPKDNNPDPVEEQSAQLGS